METLFNILCTLVLALVIWEVANSAIQRRLSRLSRDSHAARSARVRTLLPMLRTVIGVFILVFVVLNALSQLGVNVAPLLAGAGVVGLAIGFGSQTLVKDVITGVFLLLEDAVAVGDLVNVGGKGGVVEHLSIRSIKLRDGDGSIHIVPFSTVTTVTNSTRDFAFAMADVLVSYETNTDEAGAAIKAIVAEMRTEPRFERAIRDEFDFWGVDNLGQVGVLLRGRVRTEPTQRWPVQRELHAAGEAEASRSWGSTSRISRWGRWSDPRRGRPRRRAEDTGTGARPPRSPPGIIAASWRRTTCPEPWSRPSPNRPIAAASATGTWGWAWR